MLAPCPRPLLPFLRTASSPPLPPFHSSRPCLFLRDLTWALPSRVAPRDPASAPRLLCGGQERSGGFGVGL